MPRNRLLIAALVCFGIIAIGLIAGVVLADDQSVEPTFFNSVGR